MVAFLPQASGLQNWPQSLVSISAVPNVRRDFGTRNEDNLIAFPFLRSATGQGTPATEGLRQKPFTMAAAIGQNTPGTGEASQFDPNRLGLNSSFAAALSEAIYDVNMSLALPPVDLANTADAAPKVLEPNVADRAPDAAGYLAIAAPDVQKTESDNFRPDEFTKNLPTATNMLVQDAEGNWGVRPVYYA